MLTPLITGSLSPNELDKVELVLTGLDLPPDPPLSRFQRDLRARNEREQDMFEEAAMRMEDAWETDPSETLYAFLAATYYSLVPNYIRSMQLLDEGLESRPEEPRMMFLQAAIALKFAVPAIEDMTDEERAVVDEMNEDERGLYVSYPRVCRNEFQRSRKRYYETALETFHKLSLMGLHPHDRELVIAAQESALALNWGRETDEDRSSRWRY